jgi:hypothetical protein
MVTPNSPTVIYPNGGDNISASSVLIRWTPVSYAQSFALYFTDEYDTRGDFEWQQIATIPSLFQAFSWRPVGVRSDKCRIGICAIGTNGLRSPMAVSAANFSYRRQNIPTPYLISPLANQSYDKYITIQVDDSALVGAISQRTYYQFYYSSLKQDIPSTPIQQNVAVGSDPVIWNTIDLPPSDDYVLDTFLQDDAGNTSNHVYLTFSLSHEGYFLLDTTPPVAAITVNNGNVFTNSPVVSVQISSYDATTAVQSMQLQESDGTLGQPAAPANVATFTLSAGDGFKQVELLLQDFAGNRNNQVVQRLFQPIVELNQTNIVDIAFDSVFDAVWVVTSGKGNYLYRYANFPTLITTFSTTPTAVGVYQSQAYVATVNLSNAVSIYKWSGAQQLIQTFTQQDSVVNSIVAYAGDLYFGMENGNVWQYDGTNFTVVQKLPNPVRTLMSDGSQLYASLKNDLSIYVYSGTSFIVASA